MEPWHRMDETTCSIKINLKTMTNTNGTKVSMNQTSKKLR